VEEGDERITHREMREIKRKRNRNYENTVKIYGGE